MGGVLVVFPLRGAVAGQVQSLQVLAVGLRVDSLHAAQLLLVHLGSIIIIIIIILIKTGE